MTFLEFLDFCSVKLAVLNANLIMASQNRDQKVTVVDKYPILMDGTICQIVWTRYFVENRTA